MNLYLLQVIENCAKFLSVTLLSFFGMYNSVDTEIKNPDVSYSTYAEREVLKYETVYEYDSRMPMNATKVIQEGVDGVVFVNHNDNTQIILREPVTEVVKVGSGPEGEYTGKLTGYGPDCPGCSAVGNVACLTREGTRHSLINDGIYYHDSEYGDVRILAAATSYFICGTIIKVENSFEEPFLAIVLDTGYDMRRAWQNNYVWFDLAFASQDGVLNKSSNGASFSVQRWGW